MKRHFILSGAFAFLFALLIAFVKLLDVAAIGPLGTAVGLSSLNEAFHTLTGVLPVWDLLTDAVLLLAILAVGAFALLGVIQLFKRRSLKKVDAELLSLGGAVLLLAALYVAFEVLVINYRPILEDGELAASFPSSHTMLTVTLFLSTARILGNYIQAPRLVLSLKITLIVLSALSVIGRLLSGVHWFTDILGAVLIGLAVYFLFSGALPLLKEKKARKE